METSSPLPDTPVSLLRAIDGSHLRWSDFRTIVLSAFRIIFTDNLQLSELSRPFSVRLQPCLQKLNRFDIQEREWRKQVANDKGFGSSMVFPPNVLPTTGVNLVLHRSLAPKLNREALPPRVVKAQESLFELPVPRPGLLTGFTTQAFNERELSVLPHCTSATGTIVDFESGTVSPGTTTYCPFLVFERVNTASEDAVQSAKNQCAIAGAHCVRALQLLFRKCTSPRPVFEKPISFSCAIDNSTALIYYHYVDSDGCYCMSELSRFNLDDTCSFKEFQGWIEAIEDWGSTYLLPVIKIALRQLLKKNGTPPISPMPSLTLSIDTAAGSEEVLMKILRTTFGTIRWKCEGEFETPLNSSIAHCGTPLGARKIRTMALSPTSPIDILSAVSGPTTPFPVWRMRPDWSSRSPVSRRLLSPLKLRSDIPDSPCRRATLSPCTPPPEAPNSAKSPMLVLQKRVDLAMDEIQELRALVQKLQSELESKNNQLELGQKNAEISMCEKAGDVPSTPTATKQSDSRGNPEESFLPVVCPPLTHTAASLLTFSVSLPWVLFVFFVSAILSHDMFEAALYLVQAPGTTIF
ncbi:uncharacterized protein A1O5_12927 [Cladophialophora psammophila CBS 110553]|uniref:DUF7924 domain-containing protein n=1 Tax=Cladophialophora psammophila CBS 110553 TaxID=1182543 RepID=W9VRV1_9EURO|nr:uncharacterized protein A1O5_12927 [Cladophialophora psammophila CBS 110553]EXJ54861.1 hypothetical protein A1O5_12927 [Cladophialophora psammophila CBS 110553]